MIRAIQTAEQSFYRWWNRHIKCLWRREGLKVTIAREDLPVLNILDEYNRLMSGELDKAQAQLDRRHGCADRPVHFAWSGFIY